MKIRIMKIFVCVFVCAAGCFAQGTLAKQVDDLFQSLTSEGLAGSVVVIEKGKRTLIQGYGYSNNDTKVKNSQNTLYNVASIGKHFTAYSILLLEKRGLLSTADRISKHIPELANSTATIHDLLCHTSGLFKQGAELDYKTRKGFIESVAASGPESAPGEKHRYSNAGFSLLAAIVEIRSGQAFEKFIEENIFRPFGMKDTGYPWEPRLKGKPLATGYNNKHEAVPVQEDIWAARGPGNLVTTVLDLSKWIEALQTPSKVPTDLRSKMLNDYRPGDDTYGWNRTVTKHGTKFLHKGGGRSDFESRLMWFPDDGILVIFSLNNDFDLARKLFAGVAEIIN